MHKTSFPKPPMPFVIFHQMTQRIAKNIVKTLPSIVRRLPEPPFFIQKNIAEKILAKLMAEQIDMGDFDILEDKWLQLKVNDMELTFFLSFAENKLVLSNQVSQADVCFSGDAKEFVLLASRTEDPDTLFFQRRLVIEGDTELGLHIKNSIDGIDFEQWPNWLNRSVQELANWVSEDAEKIN